MELDGRKRPASLPFSEKIRILEKLRDRSRTIAASGLRKEAVRQQMRKVQVGRNPPGPLHTADWTRCGTLPKHARVVAVLLSSRTKRAGPCPFEGAAGVFVVEWRRSTS